MNSFNFHQSEMQIKKKNIKIKFKVCNIDKTLYRQQQELESHEIFNQISVVFINLFLIIRKGQI